MNMVDQNDDDRPLPVLLTSNELARMLKIQPSTLRRWRKERKGPDYVILATRPRYPLASVERWLANRVRTVEQ